MNVPSGSSSGLYAGILGHNFFKEDSNYNVINQDLLGTHIPLVSLLGKETDESEELISITTAEDTGVTEIKNWESGFYLYNGYSLFNFSYGREIWSICGCSSSSCSSSASYFKYFFNICFALWKYIG